MTENEDLEQKDGLDEASDYEMENASRGDNLIGALIGGRYTIKRQIGAGGMGVVYLAYQEGLGRNIVIKVMRDTSSDEAEGRIRFEREAKGLSKLEHQNIVTVYDFGSEGELFYIAMEYIDGETLSRFMRRRDGMTFATFAPIAMQILSALAEAHRIGIIHRDLKPGNVMLCQRQGFPNFVKVLDFGLAKLVHSKQEVTKKSELVGSVTFMSPEQILGKDKIGKGVDVYALGVLFFNMLSGRKPFEGDDDMSILYNHVHTPAPSLRDVLPDNHDVPNEVILLVERCLRKNPLERPRDAGEIIHLLRSGVESSSVLTVPWSNAGEFTPFPHPRSDSSLMSRPESFERSRSDVSGIQNNKSGGKKALIGLALLLLIGAGVVGFFLWSGQKEPADPLIAEVPSQEPVDEDESKEPDRSGMARGHRVAGLAALESGDYDEAVKSFTRALQLGGAGNDVTELLQIARTLLDNEAARKAGEAAKAVAVSAPAQGAAQASASRPAPERSSPAPARAPVARSQPARSSSPESSSRSSSEDDSSDAEEVTTGMLLIASTPNGIAFKLNDNDGGVTPMRLTVPAGSHTVTYYRDGTPIATRTVTVQAGKLAVADASLREDPPAAESVAASRPSEEQPAAREVSPPTTAPEVASKAEPQLEAPTLEPPTSAATTTKAAAERPTVVGEILVESPNVYGEVWVNGRQVGFPPTVVQDVPVGPARIEIKVDGRTRRSKTVRVDENRRASVRM